MIGLQSQTLSAGGVIAISNVGPSYYVVSAAATLNLPPTTGAASTVEGRSITVKNTSLGNVVLTPNGADTVDGNPNLTVLPGKCACIRPRAGIWDVIFVLA